jgi:hypothetical protein
MARKKELKTYGGYVTQEQEDKLLVYCQKNKITKARAIGLFIDTLDLDSLENKDRDFETLKLDFSDYKESAISEVKEINQRLYEIEKTLNKLEKNQTIESKTDRSQIENKGITRSELSKLLGRSPKTIENNSKNIENYTYKIIGIAYKYDVKTKLYYPTK